MLDSRRKFKRFELPLRVKFKPTYGAKDYTPGLTTNVSGEGIGVEADDFRFIKYENLDLIIELPESGNAVALAGDVLWKKQRGKGCLAGIKLRMKNKRIQREGIEKILSSANIPVNSLYSNDLGLLIHKEWALPNKLGITRNYHRGGTKCTVTFRLLKETAKNAQNVTIVGDFNNWNRSQSPMTQVENGDFVIIMDLDSDRKYRFIYSIDNKRWENDRYADRYARNDTGAKVSVVAV